MTKQDEDILKQVMKGTYNPEENYTYSSLKEIAKRGISAGKQEGIKQEREHTLKEVQEALWWIKDTNLLRSDNDDEDDLKDKLDHAFNKLQDLYDNIGKELQKIQEESK